jgi:hypothetical protein
MNTTLTTTDATLAPVITALHEVYDILTESVLKTEGVQLPPAIFTVQRSERAWGHISIRPTWAQEQEELDGEYAYAGWAISMGLTPTKTTEKGFHEIMVSGENLRRGARAVFGTTAHETAHAYNIVQGIRDVDSNGRHNKKFQATAERVFGLTITKVSESIGWSHTEVSDECATRWADCITKLEDAIAVVSGTKVGQGGGISIGGFGGMFGGGSAPKGRNKNLLKATCECGRAVRTSQKDLPFVGACRGCGTDFEVRG